MKNKFSYDMFLEKFRIQNFRGIHDLTLTFNEGLNIIIGENNSGKTRIIDALRLCLGYKDIDRTIYINENDFTVGLSETESIEFSLYFKGNLDEQELFYDIFNPETQYLEIHFKYYIKVKNNRKRIYNKVWGGHFEGQHIPDEIFQELCHIYLDPLRDSRKYLHPGRNNILGKFFSKVESEYDKNELIQDLNEQINEHRIMDLIKSSKEGYIDFHLDGMTHSDFPQFDINLIPEEYDNFVNNFFITLPVDGGNLELYQNGLGYNNLIYMSILLGNLRDMDDESIYTALCVEEPEAHLHPQLQKSFFNYLMEFLDNDYSFQIFMTSHSPILVSHTNLESLIILEKINNEINAVNWNDLNLDDKDKIYFRKFFNMSKVNLLFSKKVIIVEGRTEGILLQLFDKTKFNLLNNENIEIIETDSKDSMEHYIKLFSMAENKLNLKKKCSVLIDNDKKKIDDDPSGLSKKFKQKYCKENICIFESEKDIEFEIIYANINNIDLLEELLIDDFVVKNISLTKEFISSLRNPTCNKKEEIFKYLNKKKIKKTNFAIKIVEEFENLDNFKIPKVIENLFEFLKED